VLTISKASFAAQREHFRRREKLMRECCLLAAPFAAPSIAGADIPEPAQAA
jgi:hypothetical protein